MQKGGVSRGGNAIVAQLAERRLPKPQVAGSTPVYRSMRGLPVWESSFFSVGWSVWGNMQFNYFVYLCIRIPEGMRYVKY